MISKLRDLETSMLPPSNLSFWPKIYPFAKKNDLLIALEVIYL